MLTFICYTKCSTCQKAKALLDDYNAVYEMRDIKKDNPSYDELKGWLTLSGLPVRKPSDGAYVRTARRIQALRAFIEKNRDRLAPLSVREGRKYL